MKINDMELLTREEFFREERMPRFEVMPLDMMLAKAQHQLLRRTRQELMVEGKDKVEESFRVPHSLQSLSAVTFTCFKVTGQPYLLDLVMRVEDQEQKNMLQRCGWILAILMKWSLSLIPTPLFLNANGGSDGWIMPERTILRRMVCCAIILIGR